MSYILRIASLIPLLFCLLAPARSAAQAAALRGEVVDPSGALVPGAAVTLSRGAQALHTQSSADGRYEFRDLAPGAYGVAVSAEGFAPLAIPDVAVVAGQTKNLDLHLGLAVERQEVTVEGRNRGVSLSPDQNASATVLRGSDLDALSDDPDELQSELEALAGPAAGPNGGQIYIDGFQGGQLPPKSSILEIRVNQNPFSAEFERIGYGRVEIITKPGAQKLSGSFGAFGTDSAFNTANPLVSQQPAYYYAGVQGNISGPLSKHASGFLNVYRMTRQNQSIVDAIDPQNTAANLTEAYLNPSTLLYLAPRVDMQLGNNNTVTIRDSYYHSTAQGNDVGTLNLPQQGIDLNGQVNTLQFGDTILVNSQLVNETHFQWTRVRNNQTPAYLSPAVTVQGAFTDGGNSAGAAQDHQDDLELQNYSTATAGNHALRFGMRLQTYRDANYSTAESNGAYIFSSIAAYQAMTPSQYSATVIENPLARALIFDGAFFFQDDWRWKPNFDVGLGLRLEGQNRIHNHLDGAPRLELAWSPRHAGNAPAKTVVRAGYGWFYNPFIEPNSFGSAGGTPYIVQAVHDNGINQQSYVVTDPGFYNPNAPQPPGALTSANSLIPSYHTIDPHFHAALDMQGGVGIDRQLGTAVMGNLTYLYTQGVHQYLTNNVSAPAFNPATYAITGAAPATYNYQFQSGGVYKQQQLIATISARLKHLTVNGIYTFNEAGSDTQGATSFPSVAQNPGLDYGRAAFGIRHRLMLVSSYSGPYGIVVASLLVAQSGTPYSLTIGDDLTGNNQFNARPTYGVCGAPGVVATRYGCLDTDPIGKGERMVPIDVGTGPANDVFHLRLSKVIGVGPKVNTEGAGQSYHGEGSVSGRGLSSGGAAIPLDAAAQRKYNLTFVFGANNLFNIVNLGPPNGVLMSPLFGKTQSLATGSFATATPGNRTLVLQAFFSF